MNMTIYSCRCGLLQNETLCAEYFLKLAFYTDIAIEYFFGLVSLVNDYMKAKIMDSRCGWKERIHYFSNGGEGRHYIMTALTMTVWFSSLCARMVRSLLFISF